MIVRSVKLFLVEWDDTYNNVRYFDSQESRDNYFGSPVAEFTPNNIDFGRYVDIQIPVPLSPMKFDAFNYAVIEYKDESALKRKFYYFVKDTIFTSGNNIQLKLSMDIMQQYFNIQDIDTCFIHNISTKYKVGKDSTVDDAIPQYPTIWDPGESKAIHFNKIRNNENVTGLPLKNLYPGDGYIVVYVRLGAEYPVSLYRENLLNDFQQIRTAVEEHGGTRIQVGDAQSLSQCMAFIFYANENLKLRGHVNSTVYVYNPTAGQMPVDLPKFYVGEQNVSILSAHSCSFIDFVNAMQAYIIGIQYYPQLPFRVSNLEGIYFNHPEEDGIRALGLFNSATSVESSWDNDNIRYAFYVEVFTPREMLQELTINYDIFTSNKKYQIVLPDGVVYDIPILDLLPNAEIDQETKSTKIYIGLNTNFEYGGNLYITAYSSENGARLPALTGGRQEGYSSTRSAYFSHQQLSYAVSSEAQWAATNVNFAEINSIIYNMQVRNAVLGGVNSLGKLFTGDIAGAATGLINAGGSIWNAADQQRIRVLQADEQRRRPGDLRGQSGYYDSLIRTAGKIYLRVETPTEYSDQMILKDMYLFGLRYEQIGKPSELVDYNQSSIPDDAPFEKKHFAYLRATVEHINADMPMWAKDRIRSILERGVRIWKEEIVI